MLPTFSQDFSVPQLPRGMLSTTLTNVPSNPLVGSEALFGFSALAGSNSQQGILITNNAAPVRMQIDHDISTKKYMDPIHGYIGLDQL